MANIAIENARIWDGTGAAPYPGTVLVEGSRIGAVMAHADATVPDGFDRLDAAGRFLMPGMVEGHAHPSFLDAARAQALGEVPPEDHAIATLLNAQCLLDSGFTSLCSAASAKIRADIATRNAINSGAVVGPRMLAASPELQIGNSNRQSACRREYRLGL